jgi:hypothetical protein
VRLTTGAEHARTGGRRLRLVLPIQPTPPPRTSVDAGSGPAAEQVLLRRLALFAGSFSLEAAAAVGGDDVDVLPALAGLVEQSLLVPLPAPQGRYRALEPVRQYAAARLAGAGEAEIVADRAAAFFVRFAVGARAGLHGSEQAGWLDQLAAEHAHLGATLGRLTGTGRVAEAARLGADTWLYWALRGNTAEALALLEDIAAVAGAGSAALPDRERAGLAVALAGLRFAAGDLGGMQAHTAEAIAVARRAQAPDLLAEALVLAGSAAVFVGDVDRAAALMADRGLQGDPWAAAHADIVRAQLLMATGDVPAASAAMQQAERAARTLASPFTLATALNMQASLALAADEDRGGGLPPGGRRPGGGGGNDLDAGVHPSGARGDRRPRRSAGNGGGVVRSRLDDGRGGGTGGVVPARPAGGTALAARRAGAARSGGVRPGVGRRAEDDARRRPGGCERDHRIPLTRRTYRR